MKQMYNGRHCIKEDYDRVNDSILYFFSLINKKDMEAINYGLSLAREAASYDEELSNRLLRIIQRAKSEINEDNKNKILEGLKVKCQPIFNELVSNILVDIQEHNS